jgi:hypothetical protein
LSRIAARRDAAGEMVVYESFSLAANGGINQKNKPATVGGTDMRDTPVGC